MCYKCPKINPNHGRLYIDSPDWIKNKKAATNAINKKGINAFNIPQQLQRRKEEIKIDPQRITKIKRFIKKYNWKERNFPSEKYDWKNVRKIIEQLLSIFCMLKKKVYILPMFQNKIWNTKNEVILLMIPNGKGRHYLAVI